MEDECAKGETAGQLGIGASLGAEPHGLSTILDGSARSAIAPIETCVPTTKGDPQRKNGQTAASGTQSRQQKSDASHSVSRNSTEPLKQWRPDIKKKTYITADEACPSLQYIESMVIL